MVIHELNSTELIQMHNQSIISQRIVMLLHPSKNSYIKRHSFVFTHLHYQKYMQAFLGLLRNILQKQDCRFNWGKEMGASRNDFMFHNILVGTFSKAVLQRFQRGLYQHRPSILRRNLYCHICERTHTNTYIYYVLKRK